MFISVHSFIGDHIKRLSINSIEFLYIGMPRIGRSVKQMMELATVRKTPSQVMRDVKDLLSRGDVRIEIILNPVSQEYFVYSAIKEG
jgi:hypothetical protein